MNHIINTYFVTYYGYLNGHFWSDMAILIEFWANFDPDLYKKFLKFGENCVYVFGHNF